MDQDMPSEALELFLTMSLLYNVWTLIVMREDVLLFSKKSCFDTIQMPAVDSSVCREELPVNGCSAVLRHCLMPHLLWMKLGFCSRNLWFVVIEPLTLSLVVGVNYPPLTSCDIHALYLHVIPKRYLWWRDDT